ncbi:hypothetical protein Glove_37g138 [Diversispora epigaea]|uniref:Uncharacterized protein n=1 Tax=Diversispora epigaea TaxID=1348612 RepID=A0A397JIF1_9GLOM|nr:hypothetical protein Glove_37g138 [Diversispora epigaea]
MYKKKLKYWTLIWVYRKSICENKVEETHIASIDTGVCTFLQIVHGNIDNNDINHIFHLGLALSSGYIDITTTDTLGKSLLHPIYISLRNIPTWKRNKKDTKQLLGYFLILFDKNEIKKRSSEFKKLVCETFHKSLKFLLDPLFEIENENGIHFKFEDKNIYYNLQLAKSMYMHIFINL